MSFFIGLLPSAVVWMVQGMFSSHFETSSWLFVLVKLSRANFWQRSIVQSVMLRLWFVSNFRILKNVVLTFSIRPTGLVSEFRSSDIQQSKFWTLRGVRLVCHSQKDWRECLAFCLWPFQTVVLLQSIFVLDYRYTAFSVREERRFECVIILYFYQSCLCIYVSNIQ